jgi:hypothetical protein
MKFKDFYERPIMKKTEDIEERFVLSESTHIENTDMEHFKKVLKNPTHGKYVLRSYRNNYTDEEREVDILALEGRTRIVLTYNADFLEFTQEMVDLCDDLNYTTKYDKERQINTQTLTIYK